MVDFAGDGDTLNSEYEKIQNLEQSTGFTASTLVHAMFHVLQKIPNRFCLVKIIQYSVQSDF